MAGSTTIREIAERNAKMLALKPTRGHLTGVTKARIEEGLRCVIEDGPWKLMADMPAKAGGEDSAPSPGVLGRGALASCLAIGISVWAARLEVPITAVEVEVQADFDARGELGVGENIPPGYREVRYLVSIDSSASEGALVELLETAMSSVLPTRNRGFPGPLLRANGVHCRSFRTTGGGAQLRIRRRCPARGVSGWSRGTRLQPFR